MSCHTKGATERQRHVPPSRLAERRRGEEAPPTNRSPQPPFRGSRVPQGAPGAPKQIPDPMGIPNRPPPGGGSQIPRGSPAAPRADPRSPGTTGCPSTEPGSWDPQSPQRVPQVPWGSLRGGPEQIPQGPLSAPAQSQDPPGIPTHPRGYPGSLEDP
ncbi:PREDICTED: proline-rich proteoglycan 2-like [Nipponia nippon]|uniref:proline-rich proteoglycan 2-like n=1 Tax=Nipponia nippon TaxID=128390 RepID=UPI0005117C60|nr:PREDICTED: proline-rich proteoglycan 2-like [Nipponia nippon]